MWTTVELHELYTELAHSAHVLYQRQLFNNLLEYLGNDVIEMKIKGCASLICFREHVPYKLCMLDGDGDPCDNIAIVAKQIVEEAQAIVQPRDYDLSQFVGEVSVKLTNCSLLSLVSKLMLFG